MPRGGFLEKFLAAAILELKDETRPINFSMAMPADSRCELFEIASEIAGAKL